MNVKHILTAILATTAAPLLAQATAPQVEITAGAKVYGPQGDEVGTIDKVDGANAVVNTGKTPTILTLMGRDDFEPEELATLIKAQCKPGQFFSFNVGEPWQS